MLSSLWSSRIGTENRTKTWCDVALDLEDLPPLKAIEAFILVAGNGSLTQAAYQLRTSPSTLSRRIKQLEDYLQERLFIRGGANLKLTAVGTAYLEHAKEAVSILAEARQNAADMAPRIVSLTAPHIFVKKFIAPHLVDFQRRYSDIVLNIQTIPQPNGLEDSKIDLAIRFGIDWPGLTKETLFLLCGSPGCAPILAYGEEIPRRVEALCKHRLLHFRQEPEGWDRFFKAVGAKGVKGESYQFFDDADLLYAAACQGLGIVLLDSMFHKDMLETGHLIRPFVVDAVSGDGFHIIFAPDAKDKPKVRQVCDWLHSLPEIQSFRERQERAPEFKAFAGI